MKFILTNWATYFFAPEDGGGGGTIGSTNEPAPNSSGDEPWFNTAAPEHHEWLGNKQFADLNTAIASHRNLEKLVGRDRLAVPKDVEDADAYNAIYKALGRPETSDKYALPEDTKITGEAMGWFTPLAHKAGLSQEQFNAIVSGFEEYGNNLGSAAETERANREAVEIAELEKQWGSNRQANEDIAARAFRALGIEEDVSEKIEQAIGYKKTMELFHQIGSGMGEAPLHQDGTRSNGGMGGDAMSLQNNLNDKFNNPDFMKRYMHSDPRVRQSAITEIEGLQKRIAELKG